MNKAIMVNRKIPIEKAKYQKTLLKAECEMVLRVFGELEEEYVNT